MLWLSWTLLVLCTCFLKPKKISSVARLPNETDWKISDRRKSSTRTVDNAYQHPYSRNHSTSFENSNPFQYNATPAANNAYTNNKYATQIAPHIEKLQLPESCENRYSSVLMSQQQNDRPLSLSRHHPPTPQGAWIDYNNIFSPAGTSPYYYQDHNNGGCSGGHENNSSWYPSFVKSRAA